MARKRNKLKDLDYNSKEYWNRLLAEEGLSMQQGEDPRLVYVGDGNALAVTEALELERNTGRKKPKTAGE